MTLPISLFRSFVVQLWKNSVIKLSRARSEVSSVACGKDRRGLGGVGLKQKALHMWEIWNVRKRMGHRQSQLKQGGLELHSIHLTQIRCVWRPDWSQPRMRSSKTTSWIVVNKMKGLIIIIESVSCIFRVIAKIGWTFSLITLNQIKSKTFDKI